MGCFTDCMKCCSAGLGVLILLGATLGISITNIVMGATNLNSNCTGIEQIPAYLITSGVLGLVAVLVRDSDNDKEDTEGGEGDAKKKKQSSQFCRLIRWASVGVLIWGSIILFGADRPECDRVLYDYAFAVNITAYALLAVLLLISCFAFGVVCCEACADKCCGDGESECKYHCTFCGRTCCADDATNTKLCSAKEFAQQQTNTTSNVVIEMPPEKNMATTSHIATEC